MKEEKIQENVRKVDLSGLPSSGRKTRWKESVGLTVPFIYDDIIDTVLIKEYNVKTRALILLYNDEEFTITTNNFSGCRLGIMVGSKNRNHEYKVGEIVKTNSGDVKIEKLIRMNLKTRNCAIKSYEYICLKCENKNTVTEDNLKKGKGCPICCKSSSIIRVGENTFYDTYNYLMKYIKNPEDAKKFLPHTNNMILTKCNICRYEKEKSINHLSRFGYSCSMCSDSISYPNAFVASFVNQLKDDAIFEERSLEWAYGRIYDVYIPSLNMIIENHGAGHYIEGFERMGGRTLNEEKENDSFKRKNAFKNGIEYYIELDCRKSEMKYIKKSIMKSELPSILNFKESDIDWIKCHTDTFKSITHEVCKLWESGIDSSWEISKELGISINSVIRNLKKGTEAGICNYSRDLAFEKGRKRATESAIKACSKKIEVYENGISLGVYPSIIDICRNAEKYFGKKLGQKYISYVLNGTYKDYKGFTFEYADKKESV